MRPDLDQVCAQRDAAVGKREVRDRFSVGTERKLAAASAHCLLCWHRDDPPDPARTFLTPPQLLQRLGLAVCSMALLNGEASELKAPPVAHDNEQMMEDRNRPRRFSESTFGTRAFK